MKSDRNYSCWLQGEEINDKSMRSHYVDWCAEIVSIGKSSLLQSAVLELKNGITSMLGVNPAQSDQPQGKRYLFISNLADMSETEWAIDAKTVSSLGEEGYIIRTCERQADR